MTVQPDHDLNLDKTKLLLDAFRRFGVKSFADMGGCFQVHGGYAFEALMHFPIERAVIVDWRTTEKTLERAKSWPQLEIVTGLFDDETVIEKVGNVDALLWFDVLLHQASPAWTEILRRYARLARVMVIWNQQWTGSEHSKRLHDLGREEYLKNTPVNYDSEGNLLPRIQVLFDKFDEIHPGFNKPYKDVYQWWQWGITDADLISELWRHGFGLQWMINFGTGFGLENFERHAFVFVKIKPWTY